VRFECANDELDEHHDGDLHCVNMPGIGSIRKTEGESAGAYESK